MDRFAAWAPGRVNLIGEHTDYSGGLVLPAAIQLGITVRVEGPADAIRLASDGFGAAEPIAPDGDGPGASGWGRYARAVAAELAELGRPPVGLRGEIESTLPPGAGLSSSAALEVAIALALCAVAEFELEPMQLALACQRAELRAVGVPCGILDQAASVLGREGAAILLDCSTLEHRVVPVPDRAALLVVDSGIEHSHEYSGYAQRRQELSRALAGDASPVSERRLRHVRSENERVEAFARALEAADLETAGRLLSASHASLRDDYEVSIPEIDRLVELAEAAGAYGARLLGGGFGGSVLALVDADRADAVGAEVVAGYDGAGRALTVHPSTGAEIR